MVVVCYGGMPAMAMIDSGWRGECENLCSFSFYILGLFFLAQRSEVGHKMVLSEWFFFAALSSIFGSVVKLESNVRLKQCVE